MNDIPADGYARIDAVLACLVNGEPFEVSRFPHGVYMMPMYTQHSVEEIVKREVAKAMLDFRSDVTEAADLVRNLKESV
jgi:DNA primase